MQTIIRDIEKADTELQTIISCSKGSGILTFWGRINQTRHFLKQTLQNLLLTELKFTIDQNVEQHMWKLIFYNLIELLRNSMAEDQENKESYKNALLTVIDEVS